MCITIIYLGKKGAGTIFAYEMAKVLINQNCNITCILSEYIENYESFLKLKNASQNLKLYFVNTYKSKIQFFVNTLNISNFLKIKKIVENAKSDYIYIPMITVWSSILCLFIRNEKIITTIHDIQQHKGEENIFISTLSSYNIKKSDRLIVLTRSFIPIVIKRYNIAKKKICWIPHANHNYYIPERHDENAETHRQIYNKILFFGRIYQYKGLEILLKAMDILIKSHKRIILKIVGDGELSIAENKLIEKLGDRIELINRWICDDEVYSFFDDIDFTVLPYIEASQSGVIMLSYSFKKPVIVTEVGGLPEQVNSSTGIIIPPNDENALSEAISKLYENPSEIFQMGNAAYNFATNELTWEKSAEKLLEFIQE
jgi:glycosyltransferase involved in cell wall biosynthesis